MVSHEPQDAKKYEEGKEVVYVIVFIYKYYSVNSYENADNPKKGIHIFTIDFVAYRKDSH